MQSLMLNQRLDLIVKDCYSHKTHIMQIEPTKGLKSIQNNVARTWPLNKGHVQRHVRESTETGIRSRSIAATGSSETSS